MPDRFEADSLRAARYRQRAAEMRRHAAFTATKELRILLLEQAVLYDKMAELADRKCQ